MTSPIELSQDKCRTLRLAETAKELPALLHNAESNNWTYHEFINELLSYEVMCREKKTIHRLMQKADFPYEKTLADYRLAQQNVIGERPFKFKMYPIRWTL